MAHAKEQKEKEEGEEDEEEEEVNVWRMQSNRRMTRRKKKI